MAIVKVKEHVSWVSQIACQQGCACRFQRRVQIYSSMFCCLRVEGGPMHAWYDMWWDYPGHVNRWGQLVETEWKPILGP